MREIPHGDPHYGSAKYYVYQVREIATGRFYIGCRLCVGDIFKDDRYLGSGKWTAYCRQMRIPLDKTIISEHPSHQAALRREAQLIAAAKSDPLCMNGWTLLRESDPI